LSLLKFSVDFYIFAYQLLLSGLCYSLLLYMSLEYLLYIDIQLGYLHRGTEKLLEFKFLVTGLPYFDRLDYVSVVHNEHVFVLSIEYLMHISMLIRVSIVRIIMLELTRCMNGFLAISCCTMDLGSISPLLWSFEERDKLLSIFDLVCGVRMHVAFLSVGGVLDDLSFCYEIIYSSIETSLVMCDIYDLIFTSNRIIYLRLRGIALLDWCDIQYNSISGVLLRAIGFCWDLRFVLLYEIYRLLSISFCYSSLGDSYDRFIIRLFEVRQGLLAVKQLLVSYLYLFVICLVLLQRI